MNKKIILLSISISMMLSLVGCKNKVYDNMVEDFKRVKWEVETQSFGAGDILTGVYENTQDRTVQFWVTGKLKDEDNVIVQDDLKGERKYKVAAKEKVKIKIESEYINTEVKNYSLHISD